MLKNYLKIALRNVWKNKVFSIINVVGLAIGLSASFVIGVIIHYDMTFDKFHPDEDRIYRVTSHFSSSEQEGFNRGVPVPLGEALKVNAVGLEKVVVFFNTYIQKLENQKTGKVFRDLRDVVYTDKSYFELFQYQWLAGTPRDVLRNPNEVVLTGARAAKYFPDATAQEIIGNTLAYNDSVLVKVVGVVKNFEQRSDFNFQEFLSLDTAQSSHMKDQIFGGRWDATNSSTQVFVKLDKTENSSALQKRLDFLAEEHASEEMLSYGVAMAFRLQPLSDIHFNPDYGIFNNSSAQPSKTVMGGLAFVALFLLLLGCINFINLNTAQATKRAKEIGIRKTLGGARKQLIFQFLGETFLMTLSAAGISLLFSSWLLGHFADFIPQGVDFGMFASPEMLAIILVLLLAVTLLSGFYPALVLSNFKPVSVIKNRGMEVQGRFPLRKYLTVFQFVIAQIFIIATLLVGRQINFLTSKDMGFKTESNVFIRAWHDNDMDKRLNFMEALKSVPEITQTSLGGDPPASYNVNSSLATYIKNGNEIHTDLQLLFGGRNYRKLYGIELLAGRERLNDTIKEYVVNETYAKLLGFEDPLEAVGEQFKISDRSFPIVGVMKDFNQRSLHSGIEPMALVGDSETGRFSQFHTIHLSLANEAHTNWPGALSKVEDIWKRIYPEADFELNFLDDTIKQFYEQERKTSILLKWATALAILISCLGLLGLVIHSTERRTREIGIRKVLGATLIQLNVLLCKEFLILVGIAFAIATPIAWWGLNRWLEDFAYKTELSWWVFGLSGITTLLIALAVIGIRTTAAANVNPVKSLRTE